MTPSNPMRADRREESREGPRRGLFLHNEVEARHKLRAVCMCGTPSRKEDAQPHNRYEGPHHMPHKILSLPIACLLASTIQYHTVS